MKVKYQICFLVLDGSKIFSPKVIKNDMKHGLVMKNIMSRQQIHEK